MNPPYAQVGATICFLYANFRMLVQEPKWNRWFREAKVGMKGIADGLKDRLDEESRKHIPKAFACLLRILKGEETWRLMGVSLALVAIAPVILILSISGDREWEGFWNVPIVGSYFMALIGILGFLMGLANLVMRAYSEYGRDHRDWRMWVIALPLTVLMPYVLVVRLLAMAAIPIVLFILKGTFEYHRFSLIDFLIALYGLWCIWASDK